VVCPHCGTHVPDDAVKCPACRAEINSTMSMGRIEGTFCPSCGTLVPEGLETCPNCGMPVETEQPGSPDAPPVLERPAIETDVAPRFESAIPSPPDPTEGLAMEPTPQPPAHHYLFAGLLSVLLVGGAMAIITHPWNPNINDQHPTEEVDTSKAGFPGEVDLLSGQDSDPNAEIETQTVDEYTYERLAEAYVELGAYHDELEASEEALRAAVRSGDSDACAEGLAHAEELTYSISNTLSEVGVLDVSSGTYAEDLDHLLTLGNWLRNWADVLYDSWSYASQDPSAGEEALLSELREAEDDVGVNAFRALFEESYESWQPVEHVSE